MVKVDFPLDRATTAERLAQGLRRQILCGELPPGTKLKELALTQSLGVARHTAREAIFALVNEGLLTRSAYKGVQVTKLSATDIRDIYTTRRVIELSGVDALRQAPAECQDALVRRLDYLVCHGATFDSEAMHDADSAVHFAIVAALGSQTLSHTHKAALARLRLVLFNKYSSAGRLEATARHCEFGSLIAASRFTEARRQLEWRLKQAEQNLLNSDTAARCFSG